VVVKTVKKQNCLLCVPCL